MTESVRWSLTANSIRMRETGGVTLAILRLRRPDAATLATVATALGTALPSEINTVAGATPQMLWLAPDEWLLAGVSVETMQALGERLESTGALYHIADVSGGRVVFDLSGEFARDLLAKGCSLDLHPRVFAAGRCAQSLLAGVPILLQQASSEPAFRLYADTSHRTHLCRWFEDASHGLHSAGVPR